MKKAFISIYVLIILLVLALSVSFISGQNEVDTDLALNISNKKQSLFDCESFANVVIEELSLDKDTNIENLKASLSLESEIIINPVEDLPYQQVNINAKYKDTVSIALIKYDYDKNNRFILINKRIY
ncbi:hypothetical protein [uncultured Anaerococcus sp.]|uniref:hypothetical protein n=1 Tax=uncultured Anaerococcus sp. TaxID=293428 RepID=UPI00288BF585|nr:hypothetical protein [uncultured Anaerococcus sp.]